MMKSLLYAVNQRYIIIIHCAVPVIAYQLMQHCSDHKFSYNKEKHGDVTIHNNSNSIKHSEWDLKTFLNIQ